MKKSILMVDDDPRILSLLEDALAHPQLTFTKASDALKAFIAARNFPPLLIICDIQLPGYGDGLKMLKLLREDPRVPRVPFLFITGMEQKQALAMLPKNDPSIRFMSKPLDLPRLRDYVWKLAGVSA
jgi:CheY-like chemotaxis protein